MSDRRAVFSFNKKTPRKKIAEQIQSKKTKKNKSQNSTKHGNVCLMEDTETTTTTTTTAQPRYKYLTKNIEKPNKNNTSTKRQPNTLHDAERGMSICNHRTMEYI